MCYIEFSTLVGKLNETKPSVWHIKQSNNYDPHRLKQLQRPNSIESNKVYQKNKVACQ